MKSVSTWVIVANGAIDLFLRRAADVWGMSAADLQPLLDETNRAKAESDALRARVAELEATLQDVIDNWALTSGEVAILRSVLAKAVKP